jgi:hypothetical protein
MSKVDGPRAMRDARFAAYQASRTAAGAPPAPTKARVTTAPAREESPEPSDTLMPAPEGGTAVPAAAKVKPARAKAAATATQQEETLDGAAAATPDPAGELCGHRNMGGKSCQRPAGHEEKNHRYK